ncbi:hypothetical protein NE237_024319 [Protea cynaroides]|uniref:Uncharacterized protein n=1 Tax=Protea cynaroides TaxID=273540 RepID=A0A9Q0HEM8_9MAGN|nr:hypothetical protein NE237_024319 [Protea cynaroides]
MQIEMIKGRPLPDEVIVEHQIRGQHFLFQQVVEYEESPMPCVECRSFGHKVEHCPSLHKVDVDPNDKMTATKQVNVRTDVHNGLGAGTSKPIRRWADVEDEEQSEEDDIEDIEEAKVDANKHDPNFMVNGVVGNDECKPNKGLNGDDEQPLHSVQQEITVVLVESLFYEGNILVRIVTSSPGGQLQLVGMAKLK